MIDKASKAMWRRQFTPLLLPHLPPLSTLVETADKLNAAKGFIEPLSHQVESEREYGLFVAKLAIDYAMTMLDHLGFSDKEDYPPPIHLDQAKTALTNWIGEIQEYIQLGQMAGRGSQVSADDGISDAARRDATADVGVAKQSKRNNVPDEDDADFMVKKFLKEHPNATVKEVSKATGISTGRISGLEAWKRRMAERRAVQHSSKKQERQLTDRMLAVRGSNDDPTEKVDEDDSIWNWLLDVSPQNKKADLFSLDAAGKAKLIELSREKYRADNPQPDE